MGFQKLWLSFAEQYCLREIEATGSGKCIDEKNQSGENEREQEQENNTSISITLNLRAAPSAEEKRHEQEEERLEIKIRRERIRHGDRRPGRLTISLCGWPRVSCFPLVSEAFQIQLGDVVNVSVL